MQEPVLILLALPQLWLLQCGLLITSQTAAVYPPGMCAAVVHVFSRLMKACLVIGHIVTYAISWCALLQVYIVRIAPAVGGGDWGGVRVLGTGRVPSPRGQIGQGAYVGCVLGTA